MFLAKAARKLSKWFAWLFLAWVAVTVLVVGLLRWVDPPTSAFMIASRIDALRAGERGYRLRQEWVDFRDINASVALAVIASEDQKFAQHAGFDFDSID